MSAEPIDINTARAADGPSQPAHYIATGTGHWRFSTGRGGWARGVYRADEHAPRGWALVAPLPYVTERLTHRDGDGRRAGVEIRVTMDPTSSEAVILDADDLRAGRWPTALDVAVPTDRRIMDAATTALDAVARWDTVPVREAAPRWIRGELAYPPADVGPVGYMRHATDEAAAAAAWAELAQIAARSPKLALTVGAAVGGLFLAPMRYAQPPQFIVQLVGEARAGKTTGLMLAGAVMGDPGDCHETDDGWQTGGGIVESWNTTQVGLLQHLSSLGVYPALFDELGAAGLTPAQKERLIFQLTDRAQRRIGGKNGRGRKSAPWWSVLISTGNESITSGVVNEGSYARVLEVPTPITTSTADAERVPELVAVGYGWPLQWMQRQGRLDADRFRAAVSRAQNRLGMPTGGVPRTLAKHIAVCMAGAELLAQAIGTPEDLAGAAAATGGEILSRMTAEIKERGLTPGARLWAAVTEALATRPAAFPTVEDYRAALRQDPAAPKLPHVIDGVYQDSRHLAVFTDRLRALAKDSGIDDPTQGLRMLRDRGQLDTGKDKDGRLKKDVRVNGPKLAAYVFVLPDEDQAPTADGGPADTVTPDTSGTSPQTRTGADEAAPADRAGADEDTPQPTLDEALEAPDETTGPAQNGAAPPRRHEPTGDDDTDTAERTAPMAPAPITGRPPARRGRRTHTDPATDVLAIAASADTLHLYTRTGIKSLDPDQVGGVLDDMGRFLDWAARLMPTGGTVALDSDAADALGYPEDPELFDHEEPEQLPMPERPVCVQRASLRSWHTPNGDNAKGVGGWTSFTRGAYREPDQVSITVACLPWMDAAANGTSGHMMLTMNEGPADENGDTPLTPDDALTACYLLGRVRELTGTPWAYTGGSTWCMGVRDAYLQRNTLRRPDLDPKAAVPRFKLNADPDKGPVCPAYATADPALLWRRPGVLEGGDLERRHVIAFDSIAAHLGRANGVENAVNGLVEREDVRWDPSVHGLWLMDPVPNPHYRGDHQGPPLAGPAATTDRQWWAHTHQVEQMIKWQVIPSGEFTTTAWVPIGEGGQIVRGSTQVLRKFGDRVKNALASIPRDTDDPWETRVREALTSMYKEAAGEMTRHPWLMRPDWSMGIWSGSRIQTLRTAVKVYNATGQWPIEISSDCLYYETDGPDPHEHNPAPGILEIDDKKMQVGKFKIDFSGTMAEYVEHRQSAWKAGKR